VEITRVGLVYRRPRLPRTEAVPPRLARAAPSRMWSPDHGRRVADREESPPILALPASQPPELGREAFARVMEHANASGAEEAERIAEVALRRRPLDAPLHYLRAALLLSLDRDQEAEHEAQRALYLDRSLAVGHFLLGTILRKRGARPLAQRAFRNVRDLCAARPSDEEVPAGAGALHFAASAEMARLEVTGA